MELFASSFKSDSFQSETSFEYHLSLKSIIGSFCFETNQNYLHYVNPVNVITH